MLVGAFNTVFCGAITFGALHLLGFNYIVAYVIGAVIGVVSSFLLNKHFTFKSQRHWKQEAIKFFIGFVISYIASTLMLITSVEFFKISHDTAIILSMMTYTTVNYLLNKKMVFA